MPCKQDPLDLGSMDANIPGFVAVGFSWRVRDVVASIEAILMADFPKHCVLSLSLSLPFFRSLSIYLSINQSIYVSFSLLFKAMYL